MKSIEMQSKLFETLASLSKESEEEYGTTLGHNEEMRSKLRDMIEAMNTTAAEHESFKRKVGSEMEKLSSHEKELDSQETELEERQAECHNERRKLRRFRKMNEVILLEQKVQRLAEVHERGNKELIKQMLELRKQMDRKGQVEQQIEELTMSARVVERMGMDAKTRKKIDAIEQELKAIEEETEALHALNNELTVEERKCNDEVQEVRKELIRGLDSIRRGNPSIAVKTVGVLDEKVFRIAAKEKYLRTEAARRARELINQWKTYVRDPHWHPFKRIEEKGVLKEVIDVEDERLQSLREELGEEACWAAITAITELNEYNPSGRYPVQEIWNFEAERKATLKEACDFILSQIVCKGKSSKGGKY